MKKLIILLLSASLGGLFSNAYGNGYCDGRGNAQAINQCYIINIQTLNTSVNRHYKILANSPKYTPKQKADLERNQLQWEDSVRKQCRVNSCVDQSYLERDRSLIVEINRLNKSQ